MIQLSQVALETRCQSTDGQEWLKDGQTHCGNPKGSKVFLGWEDM